jgi:hypothetical protein
MTLAVSKQSPKDHKTHNNIKKLHYSSPGCKVFSQFFSVLAVPGLVLKCFLFIPFSGLVFVETHFLLICILILLPFPCTVYWLTEYYSLIYPGAVYNIAYTVIEEFQHQIIPQTHPSEVSMGNFVILLAVYIHLS